ncbi:MAG: site-specific DNA-methyltransferase, partial [Clostridiales bacterium]|nr:site-specific DNA-methyltransferase [Clostridiales bacterium]
METNRIIQGDALAVLRTLPDCSVHCCVTSPPYFGLRDYGVDGQIGLERSLEAYIARLCEVFRELRRVLRDDGTLWINIGDSYAHSAKGLTGCKPKDLIGVPWALAFALRADGWAFRSDIIWHKTNAMPNSVTDRPGNTYEHLFLLAKSSRYHFDYTALMEPVRSSTEKRRNRGLYPNKYTDGAPGQTSQSINRSFLVSASELPSMRRGRDIWSVGTSNYRGAFFAAFPEALVRPCIAAGCPEGGVVLDPFFGSGTTGVAALSQGRRYLG